MIDVHIIVGEHEPWLNQCLGSLENEPIKIWTVKRIEGDLSKAREIGFSKGSSEYVSFVDPDDYVIPGAFQICLDALESNPDCVGVYTSDELIDEQGNHISYGWALDQKPFDEIGFPPELTAGIHHLRVFRRSAVEKCLPLKTKRVPEPLLNLEIQQHGPLLHLPIIGYRWRMHKGNTFTKYSQEELNEAIKIARDLQCKIGTNSESSRTTGSSIQSSKHHTNTQSYSMERS